ncbi:hypothetical protein VdG1_01545 [Verticillium dahliae VDG1]|nr:hypothetical protein VdG1_01545 [Verticillium dahliae VDG1]
MPMHQGILPREGLTADPIFSLLGRTALNPSVLLPLVLLARYTKKGGDLAILYPTAFARIKLLLYASLARWANAWLSDRVLNNWTSDRYDWRREIAFLPAMVRANHGTIVTVASFAAFLAVPNMVDYGASKAAAMAFHEGLTAELTTRYKAPRVRTVLVNQGYTKTALFTGYNQDTPFLMPALEPETVAEAIVRQILTGRSGQVIVPGAGASLAGLRAYPHWWQVRLRAQSEKLMSSFSGRQVVKDLDKHYDGRDKEADESTVLVK